MAKYLHCSMAGSYHIKCEVMGKPRKNGDISIRYYDFMLDEHVTRTVGAEYVTISAKDIRRMEDLPMSPRHVSLLDRVFKKLAEKQATS